MTYPYKHVLQAMIDGVAIQRQRNDGPWVGQTYAETLREISNEVYPANKYRAKPRAITINGFEVPEPVRKPLEHGQRYYLADTADDGVTKWYWDDGDADNIWLNRGLIHLDEGAALLHVEALLSFTKRDES